MAIAPAAFASQHAALCSAWLDTDADERERLGPEASSAWMNVLKIAETLNDTDYLSRALCRDCGCGTRTVKSASIGRSTRSHIGSETSRTAPQISSDSLIGDRMIGLSLQFMGDLGEARAHMERLLRSMWRQSSGLTSSVSSSIRRVRAQTSLATILWPAGFS